MLTRSCARLTTPGPSVGPDAPSPLWQPLGGLSPQRVRSQVRPFPPVMVVMEDTPVQSRDMAPEQAVSTKASPRTSSTGGVDARSTQLTKEKKDGGQGPFSHGVCRLKSVRLDEVARSSSRADARPQREEETSRQHDRSALHCVPLWAYHGHTWAVNATSRAPRTSSRLVLRSRSIMRSSFETPLPSSPSHTPTVPLAMMKPPTHSANVQRQECTARADKELCQVDHTGSFGWA